MPQSEIASPMRLKLPQEDTIAAIATPPGEGGIGIVRLSGPRAPEVLGKIWQGRLPLRDFESHRLYFGSFTDPQSGETLDEGMAVWMKAPRSYTGEEVLEIQAHGGPLILNRLLEILVQEGLRVAQPGEFTRRAFLNGKMDLLQAEAVGELIHAQSEAALKNAHQQLEGRLSQEVNQLRRQVVELVARIEAAIDFPDEDIEIIAPEQTRKEISALEAVLNEWQGKFRLGRLVREGVRLALVGRPNVGKSSLLNHLVGEEKAIVHSTPGTTRDVVEGWMEIEGVSFHLMDTAGIREGSGPVEREGIQRSLKASQMADLTLWVLDVSQKLTEEDYGIMQSLEGRALLVGNKADLTVEVSGLPEKWAPPPEIRKAEWHLVSAQTGEGIPSLKVALAKEMGLSLLQEREQAYLNNARHREGLAGAAEALERARLALENRMPSECVAADLRQATAYLGCLLGEISNEDVLDKIFSEFCLGK